MCHIARLPKKLIDLLTESQADYVCNERTLYIYNSIIHQSYVRASCSIFFDDKMSNFNLYQYPSSKSNKDRYVIKSLRRVVSLKKMCSKKSMLRQKSKSMVIYKLFIIAFKCIIVKRMF